MKYFVRKLSQPLIEKTCLILTEYITKGNEEKREFATIALKTVILQMPISQSSRTVSAISELILSGFNNADLGVQQDSLEILNELAVRFALTFNNYHQIVQNICISLLKSDQRTLRKRCIKLLATISITSSDELFHTLMEDVSSGLKTSLAKSNDVKISIQVISSVAKKAGHRLGKYLKNIFSYMMKITEDISEDENQDEIRENIIEALELFVLKSPIEISPHIDLIIILCKEYIEYDPNYTYESSDEDVMEDEEEEDIEDEDYSDDDDLTWKVRNVASKCLISIIKSRPDKLKHLYKELLDDEDFDLTSRFKEREDTVKLQILNVFKSLLSQTLIITTNPEGKQEIIPKPEAVFVEKRKDQIFSRLRRQLTSKNSKIRIGVFQVFNILVKVLQSNLQDQLKSLFVATKNALNNADQDVQIKLEALSFLRGLLTFLPKESFASIYEELSSTIFSCLEDKYFKVVADALRTTQVLIGVLYSNRNASYYQAQSKLIFQKIYHKLQLQDIDQEVKISSISAMSEAISVLGENLGTELNKSFDIFVDRLKNETTRIPTIRALNQISQSKFDITPVLHDIVAELSSFLRKSNRSLRQNALICLSNIIKNFNNKLTKDEINRIIEDMTSLVTDSDLNLAYLTFELGLALIYSTQCSKQMENVILPKTLNLLKSNTLQGYALSSLISFIQGISKTMDFKSLLDQILKILDDSNIGKQAYSNIGKTIAGLVETTTQNNRESTIELFIRFLQNSALSMKILAFFTLGEIGSRRDLTVYGKIEENIQECFRSEVEEVKYAASYCLGNVAVGNLEKFLPRIISKIQTQDSDKYLLIHALKQIIIQADSSKILPFINSITPILFQNANNEEESIRNIVSECLGKLVIVDYDSIFDEVKKMVTGDEYLQATAVGAMKFAVTERGVNTENLKRDLSHFLALLNKSQPVSVRKGCVLLLTSAIRNNPLILEHNFDRFLPSLYEETIFDKNLVTVVDLGPFKHKVDGGLELRKSAFECIDTIITHLYEKIDGKAFVQTLINGVTDTDYDINLLTFHIIEKCTEKIPRALLDILLQITEAIDKILKKKWGEKALPQQIEKHEDLQKASIKAYCAIESIRGLEEVQAFQLIKHQIIEKTPKLLTMYQEISNERNTLTLE